MRRAIPLLLLGLLLGAGLAWYAQRPRHRTPPATATAPAATDSVGTDPASFDDIAADAAWPASAPTPEQVMYDQPRLLERAIAALRPQTPGKVDLYLLAFAGDGAENVFRNEADYAAALVAQRFDAHGHTLVLENNPATLTTAPLANWSNLEHALAALARVMDPTEDILFVYLTSHGSEDHTLLVDLFPLPLDQIGADDLAGILDAEPFRWRVVVVNACYAGGFLPPLAGDGTLAISAARADRSSFGCGSEADITWFGDAFLAHALNTQSDFVAAFDAARTQIAAWEKRDDLPASEPQIAVGNGITSQLARWRAGFAPGPTLPFKPEPATP